ncbi:YDG/SRA domain-containing protein [Kitasatospora purpeofusca]|uniref:YDG/SRA domain-containing protein n=1 Tax=Kitasatospora purpeofusca TaxID=67352 RepID=UPI003864B9EA|nr:HNH endonuclease [Kitasatospora purpeofusca]
MSRRLPLNGTGHLVSFARELRELQERSQGTVESAIVLGASRTAVYEALRGSRLPSVRNLDLMVQAWGDGGPSERQTWRERRRSAEEGLAEAARQRGKATAGRTPEEEDFTRRLRDLWGRAGGPSTERVARHCALSARTLDSYLDGRTIPTEQRLRELFDGLSEACDDDSGWLASARESFLGEVLFRARVARKEEKDRVKELTSALPSGQPAVVYRPLPDGIGTVPGVRLGQLFDSRATLSRARVHRAMQAGITGTADRGAESIVVSRGYEDDEDYGDVIVYTGQGGRDPHSGEQVKNQELTLGNAALATSAATGSPVRVVRSADRGYRYDGLFKVEDYWSEDSRSGFRVWRFRLVSLPPGGQVSVAAGAVADVAAGQDVTPSRMVTAVQRIVRSTAVANYVKRVHDYACQVCGVRLESPNGAYAEAAHIVPLGAPHRGPDIVGNVLCLCANHHVLFDFGTLVINDDLTVVKRSDSSVVGQLREAAGHEVDRSRLREHRVRHGFWSDGDLH